MRELSGTHKKSIDTVSRILVACIKGHEYAIRAYMDHLVDPCEPGHPYGTEVEVPLTDKEAAIVRDYQTRRHLPPSSFFLQRLARREEVLGDRCESDGDIDCAIMHYVRTHRIYGVLGMWSKQALVGCWMTHMMESVCVSSNSKTAK